MAATLTTTIPAYCFSSAVPDPVWNVGDAETLHVRISCPEGEIGMIFDETLFAHQDLVRVWECREMIERTMRLNGRSLLQIILRWSDDDMSWSTKIMRVIFCESTGITDLDWLKCHFATTAPYKILPPAGQAETLPFIELGTGNDITAQFLVTIMDQEGNKQQLSLENNKEYSAQGLYNLNIDMADMASRVEAAIGSGFSILAMMVRVGQRYMTYYATREDPLQVFAFRNCFNAVEYARIDGVTETKLSDGSKVASVSRRAVKYDSHMSVSYELETAPLPLGFAQWLAQLATAPMVWLADGTEVVITDGEPAYKDEFDKLVSLKFSWQPADARARFSTGQQPGGVFNEVFNETFI